MLISPRTSSNAFFEEFYAIKTKAKSRRKEVSLCSSLLKMCSFSAIIGKRYSMLVDVNYFMLGGVNLISSTVGSECCVKTLQKRDVRTIFTEFFEL